MSHEGPGDRGPSWKSGRNAGGGGRNGKREGGVEGRRASARKQHPGLDSTGAPHQLHIVRPYRRTRCFTMCIFISNSHYPFLRLHLSLSHQTPSPPFTFPSPTPSSLLFSPLIPLDQHAPTRFYRIRIPCCFFPPGDRPAPGFSFHESCQPGGRRDRYEKGRYRTETGGGGNIGAGAGDGGVTEAGEGA